MRRWWRDFSVDTRSHKESVGWSHVSQYLYLQSDTDNTADIDDLVTDIIALTDRFVLHWLPKNDKYYFLLRTEFIFEICKPVIK